MSGHWLVYILIGALASLLYLACEKLQILRSKYLRIIIVLLVSSGICWIVYDLLFPAID